MPLIMKKTINGQPVKIRLTADVGTGNPVGTILPLYKKSNPIGYLYCDGSTFDQTVYPALYAYLGTNVLPDYREFALVGAEENTTDVYNASTNPNGTIHDHDVYTEGQAKDDQLQNHYHSVDVNNQSNPTAVQGLSWTADNTAKPYAYGFIGEALGARIGTVTRGKRKAVYFYIKATSGVMEDNTENFINVINAERSYSTSEVNTGKKWIDGKPIYRKVFYSATNWADGTTVGSISNFGFITEIKDISRTPYYLQNFGSSGQDVAFAEVTTNGDVIVHRAGSFASSSANVPSAIIVEYTKTT